MPLSKSTIEFLGTDDYTEDIIDSKVTEHLAKHQTLVTESDGLKAEVGELKKKNEELAKLEPLSKVGETYLADLRKSAEAKYKLAKGDNASADMVKLIQNADIEQAKTYDAEFGKEVEEKVPAICSSCGKPAKFSRRSSTEIEAEKKAQADSESYKIK